MTPQLADNDDAPEYIRWLASIPSIPANFPRGVLTPDEEEA